MRKFCLISTYKVFLKVDSIDDNNNDGASLWEWQVNYDDGSLQEWQVDNNESDKNEDKIYLLLRKWVWWIIY